MTSESYWKVASKGRGLDRRLLVGAFGALALALALALRPASQWLSSFTPDGALTPGTARFLDSGAWLWGLAGIVTLIAGLSAGVRQALAAGWREPAPFRPVSSAIIPRVGSSFPWLAPGFGLLAFGLRIAVAAFSDIGLGDDGARVAWLQQWLEDPHWVWSGLWLPAHLYLHALFNAVIHDLVWSGVLLSACAAGGTVWILTCGVQAHWGSFAAVVAAALATVLPVSLAYGANPDVNPVFAFFVVSSTAAVLRARSEYEAQRRTAFRWLFLSWFCLAAASWMRFDCIVLVPAIAVLLWPRRWTAIAFAVAAAVPLVLWNVADSVITQQPGRVMNVVQQDPTLGGSIISQAFTFGGGIWQAVTLPVVFLGTMGVVRALRACRGRGWIVPALAHLAALAGTTLVFHAGTQPRYFLVVASIWAAYAGVGLAGIAARSRRVAGAVGLLGLALLASTPQLYPGESDLWMRRSPELRSLVDEVSRLADGGHVVWVSEESGYFYSCRVQPPRRFYHALPRPDSDPRTVIEGLREADSAIACVQQLPLPRQRWESLSTLLAGDWIVEPLATRGNYQLLALRRTGLAQYSAVPTLGASANVPEACSRSFP